MRHCAAFRTFRRSRSRTSASPLLLASLLLCARAAESHQTALSYADLRVQGARVDCDLRLAAGDAARLASIAVSADDRSMRDAPSVVTDALVRAQRAPFSFSANGAPCPLEARSATAAPDGEDGIVLRGSYLCPATAVRLDGRAIFLDDLPPGHTLLLKLEFVAPGVANSATSPTERVLQQGAASFSALRTSDAPFAFARFLRLGVRHIFTGADHLAFLLGLLLLGGSLGALVRIVTAFTVAHSLTLALAALEIYSPPARLIEPAIAASILCIAIENLWALRRDHAPDAAARALRHRWLATFCFGLIHGFGFADALRELHLPRESLAASLLSFNLGVELGQVCVVGVALPMLARLHHWPAFARRGPQIISMAVGAAGTFWLAQRLIG